MEKMIMIPEWRYEKMLESYDEAMNELQALREQLVILKEGEQDDCEDSGVL